MATTNDPIYIFQNQTTNATTDAFYLNCVNKVVVQVRGTWDGASMKLQQGIITGTGGSVVWVDIHDRFNNTFTFTSDNSSLTLTDFIYNQPIRGVLSNAGAATNITCILQVVIGAA